MHGLQLAGGMGLLCIAVLCGCHHREHKAPEALMVIPVKCITQVEFQPAQCEETKTLDYALCQNVVIRHECISYKKP
jgi:hypothetical protein